MAPNAFTRAVEAGLSVITGFFSTLFLSIVTPASRQIEVFLILLFSLFIWLMLEDKIRSLIIWMQGDEKVWQNTVSRIIDFITMTFIFVVFQYFVYIIAQKFSGGFIDTKEKILIVYVTVLWGFSSLSNYTLLTQGNLNG